MMVDAQIRAHQQFSRRFGLALAPAPLGTSYLLASVLGLQLVFPEDDDPQILEPRPLQAGIDLSVLPRREELLDAGQAPILVQAWRAFVNRNGPSVLANFAGNIGFQGPLTTAVLLRGMALFTDLYDQPAAVGRLLDLICDRAVALVTGLRAVLGVSGSRVRRISINDDYGGMIAPQMYEQVVVPRLARLYRSWATKERRLHSETLTAQHLPYLSALDITEYDPGMNQYLTIPALQRATTIHFTWNLFTAREMLLGTPAEVQSAYQRCVAEGAPAMTTEICRSTPSANTVAFLQIARRPAGRP